LSKKAERDLRGIAKLTPPTHPECRDAVPRRAKSIDEGISL